MIKGMFLVLASVGLDGGLSFAQAQPTEFEQRMACMGDALRLCSQFVPDREQIRRCLATQRGALSAGCRPAFDASMKALNAPHSSRQ